MTSISIVYFSGSGHTHLMAEAFAEGASKIADTKVQLFRITGEQIHNGRWGNAEILGALNQSDAIIFGSPTSMGGVAAQFKAFFKAFIDGASSIWARQLWKDKLAGGFTHSGSPSGDKQGTLLYLAINAAQHSMIWVGAGEMNQNGVNRLGSYMGVMGQSVPDFSGTKAAELESGDRLSSLLYGERVANATKKWKNAN
ncbi:multimeric flavodoxin WrbA [Pseudanabaena sp. lw0831]|uniref:flavodoxin family protein n=1 Tax=Pseudanabaena sp. lw0831 TaxID=1357935 RepID=UPI001915FBA9|nr:flavodoxin family protein [Pseudanabaena sp. lw0831]GBO52987.1 multimeric flavodoxin WrbA [Pseudanabaena sp. lw0831]